MKLILRLLLAAAFAAAMTSIGFGETDEPGSKDFPGISRMPGALTGRPGHRVFVFAARVGYHDAHRGTSRFAPRPSSLRVRQSRILNVSSRT